MKKRLKHSEKEEILRIVSEENALEKTHYGSPLDGDRFVVVPSETDPERLDAFAALFFLGETKDSLPVTEVMLFTDAAKRRRRIASELLKKIKKPGSVLKFAEYASASGDGFLKQAGAVHGYDELCMTRSLSDLCRKEKKSADGADAVSFEKVPGDPGEETRRFYSRHSELYVNRFGDGAYLFGVRTDRAHMREGHAKKLLSAVLLRLSEEGAKEVLLQVSGVNVPAVRLYEKAGFAVSKRLGMWYLT